MLVLAIISCTNSNNQQVDKPTDQAIDVSEPKEPVQITKFEILDAVEYDLNQLQYEGRIMHKRFWQDSNGENIVLFTLKKPELFVFHYSIDGDKVQQLRRVYDFERDCDYDLSLGFVESSIGVTDIDGNNLGEITFAYKKACISDVSPLELKLLILENGNKFIIRGTTLINMGDMNIGGDKNIDPSFDNAPEGFLGHANQVWDQINQ